VALAPTQFLVVNLMRCFAFVPRAVPVLLIAFGCGPDVEAGDVPAEVRGAALGLTAVPPPGRVAEAAGYSAVLYSDHDADVAARKDGMLLRLSAELGDAVGAGQSVAQLEDVRERARLAAATAALELVRAEHERAEAMRGAAIISAAEYESVLYRLRTAEAALREAEVELEMTRIAAPFAGVVTRRYSSLGRSVRAGEPLYRITALQPLRAVVRVPEREARLLQVGAGAVLRSDATDPPTLVEAAVARISPAVDPGSGTVEVLLVVPQPGPLRPGSTALATFTAAAGG
jgi:membrane fusion protein, multidrug efflux system